MTSLTFNGFLLRLLFSLLLVGFTFNPSEYSYYHWFISTFKSFTPLLALAGITLLIGWVIFIRATLRSLGAVGLALATAFFGCLIWLLVDFGWLSLQQPTAFTWVVLMTLALILAIGMSWSHIRRRISGQVDTDDVEE
ncbi:MAG: DUF6524 family protein [Pseudomonadota bacterium]